MKMIPTLALVAVLLAGCQAPGERDAQLNMKTMQKTVGRERLLTTFSLLSPPPLDKRIFARSDGEIIDWLKQIDDWTHKVLSSPVTGEMDRPAMEEMRRQLTQAYTPEMAQRLIDYFYRYDSRAGTYQANSTRAMLSLRNDYQTYTLQRAQPAAGEMRLTLAGRTRQDRTETTMSHESAYRTDGERLIITEFRTR